MYFHRNKHIYALACQGTHIHISSYCTHVMYRQTHAPPSQHMHTSYTITKKKTQMLPNTTKTAFNCPVSLPWHMAKARAPRLALRTSWKGTARDPSTEAEQKLLNIQQ